MFMVILRKFTVPSHLSFTSIIKVKMNCCLDRVLMLCGFARRISVNINDNYVGPSYTTSDVPPSSQVSLLICPSFDYKYFPADPNIVAGWKTKTYSRTPVERPPSPTTIHLIRPHFV